MRQHTLSRLLAGAIISAAVGVAIVAFESAPVGADFASDCSSPTVAYPDGGAVGNLNLSAGDVVLLSGGTFTGSVNFGGGRICVDAGAALSPPTSTAPASCSFAAPRTSPRSPPATGRCSTTREPSR